MNTKTTWSDSPIHDELAAWELLKEARRERDELKRWTSVNGVIDLQRERDEARAEMILWQSIAEGRGRTDDDEQERNIGWQNKWQVAVEMAALAQNELATVTAQRDRLADQLDDAVAEATNAVNDIIGMKWQRDRLAEAIKQYISGNHPESFLREALQSLTPKP